MHADIDGFEAIEITSRVQQAINRFGVRTGRGGDANDGTIGIGYDSNDVVRKVEQSRSPALERTVELADKPVLAGRRGRECFPLGQFFERSGFKAIEELGILLAYQSNHLADHRPRLARRV